MFEILSAFFPIAKFHGPKYPPNKPKNFNSKTKKSQPIQKNALKNPQIKITKNQNCDKFSI
jgi:hypothetical protein